MKLLLYDSLTIKEGRGIFVTVRVDCAGIEEILAASTKIVESKTFEDTTARIMTNKKNEPTKG